jgi:hypothetical protein
MKTRNVIGVVLFKRLETVGDTEDRITYIRIYRHLINQDGTQGWCYHDYSGGKGRQGLISGIIGNPLCILDMPEKSRLVLLRQKQDIPKETVERVIYLEEKVGKQLTMIQIVKAICDASATPDRRLVLKRYENLDTAERAPWLAERILEVIEGPKEPEKFKCPTCHVEIDSIHYYHQTGQSFKLVGNALSEKTTFLSDTEDWYECPSCSHKINMHKIQKDPVGEGKNEPSQ